MTGSDPQSLSQVGTNLAALPYLWSDRTNAHRQTHVDSFLEAFPGLAELIPSDAVFTQATTESGHLLGYVRGDLPNADAWFTFPWLFLGNASVPREFFAAGICEGRSGNTFWLTLAIRMGERALWLRVQTGTIFGGQFWDTAQETCRDALQRWRDANQVVVAGIHAERLPNPLPSPLFADRIVDRKPESWLAIPT
jgi:hypothetical protein